MCSLGSRGASTTHGEGGGCTEKKRLRREEEEAEGGGGEVESQKHPNAPKWPGGAVHPPGQGAGSQCLLTSPLSNLRGERSLK